MAKEYETQATQLSNSPQHSLPFKEVMKALAVEAATPPQHPCNADSTMQTTCVVTHGCDSSPGVYPLQLRPILKYLQLQ
jgi:hypothetical protein